MIESLLIIVTVLFTILNTFYVMIIQKNGVSLNAYFIVKVLALAFDHLLALDS